uniref:Uncharacterized protein n=1 Tax=Monodelphis domestica TaxID=13616 RepID=A0A5F8GXS3_MONDO
MASSGPFPLVLEGPWDADPPKQLCNKLQRYFQSPRISGGGECDLKKQTGQHGLLLLFKQEEVRQRVLKRENHELELPGQEKLKLTVRLPPAKNENKISEKPVTTEVKVSGDQDTKHPLERRSAQAEGNSEDARTISSLVVFNNVHHAIREDFLTLLVENISGFSEINGDFTIEILPEAQAAVITFLKTIGKKVKDLKISASTLEMTRTILVEDLPPGVNEIFISLFFENPHNGGGPVTMVQYFPNDNSALVEFETHEGSFPNPPINPTPYLVPLPHVTSV